MNSNITEIIFDRTFIKCRSYVINKGYLWINNEKSPYSEVLLDDQFYSMYCMDDPFTDEKKVKQGDDVFDLESDNVYNLIDNGAVHYGMVVYTFLERYDRLLIEKIEERKERLGINKGLIEKQTNAKSDASWIEKIFGKKKNKPISFEKLKREIIQELKLNEEDRSMVVNLSENYFEEFMAEMKLLNFKYHKPKPIEIKHNFIIMFNLNDYENKNKLFQELLEDYNNNNSTNFKSIEFIEHDGFNFAVVSVDKANYEDLFFLGYHLSYAQDKLYRKRNDL